MIDEGIRENLLDDEPHEDEEPSNANLPIRQYLDKHIMPSLVEALEKLTQEKPDDAIQFIGEFILRQEDKMKTKWTCKELKAIKDVNNTNKVFEHKIMYD